MSGGVRVRGALFYKASAGSVFLFVSDKSRNFERKWCSEMSIKGFYNLIVLKFYLVCLLYNCLKSITRKYQANIN